MWWTPEGNRVLLGAEADLFREGLGGLISHLNLAEDAGTPLGVGVRVFDRLSLPERLAVLEQVGRALRLKGVPCPRHTAVGEGAVAAVYWHVLAEVEAEIDEGRHDVRRLIRAACAEVGLTEGLPALRSRDWGAWAEAVDRLTERIFWDNDWEQEAVAPDTHAQAASGTAIGRRRQRPWPWSNFSARRTMSASVDIVPDRPTASCSSSSNWSFTARSAAVAAEACRNFPSSAASRSPPIPPPPPLLLLLMAHLK